MQVFPQKHSKRITDLHSDRGTNFISASEDGTLQFYDLRTLQPHTQLVAGSNRVPIYSVTGNQRIVASGTTEDILIWDTRSLKQPLFRFEEGHNEDVTCLEVRNEQLLSCSIDQVLNIYNLQYQAGASEESMIDGAYSSQQSLLQCGFVSEHVIWTQTSINTVELVRVEDATLFLTISKVSEPGFDWPLVPTRCDLPGGL